jgi:DNA-binding transcriptional ArsR family regulator
MTDTGLGERTVRRHLRKLEALGLIVRGNQAIAAAHIKRRDRRPTVYDLPLENGPLCG